MTPAANRRPRRLPVDAAPAAAQVIAEAEEEIRASEELAATLEARLSGGDDSITPDDIDKAHSRARWARLRMPAAHAKAAELEAQRLAAERAARIAHHRDALRATFPQVSEMAAEAAELVRKIVDTAAGTERHVKALRVLADGMHNPHAPADSAGLVMKGGAADGGVYVDGEEFSVLDAHKLRAAADELEWLGRRAVPAQPEPS